VADALTGKGADLTFNFSGPEFTWLTHRFDIPDFSSGPFDFDLLIDTEGNRTKINLLGDLGSLDLNAAGAVDDLANPQEGEVKFDIAGPDLQLLGEAFGEARLPAAPYHFAGDVSAHLGALQIHDLQIQIAENKGQLAGRVGKWPELRDTEIDVFFSGPDLSQWGPVARVEGFSALPFTLSGRLSNRNSGVVLTTIRFEAGDSYAEVAGSLGEPPEFLGASLNVDLMTPDLGGITVLSGYGDLPSLPLSIQGTVGRNQQSLMLNGLDIRLGGDRMLLNGQIALTENLHGSDLSAAVEITSVAQLGKLFDVQNLPDLPAKVNADLALSKSGLKIVTSGSRFGDVDIDLDGQIALTETQYGSELSVTAQIPSVARLGRWFGVEELPDYPAKLNTELALSESGLKFVTSDSSFGELEFVLDGKLASLKAIDDVTAAFSFAVPSLRKIPYPLEGQELPELPARVQGRFEYQGETLGLSKVSGNIGDARFDFDALLTGHEKRDGSHLVFNVAGPDLNPLLPMEHRLPSAARFKASGKIELGAEEDRITGLKLELGELRAEVDGTADDLMQMTSASLSVSATGPDLSIFDSLTVRDVPALPFSLDASVTGSEQVFTLNPFKASLGPSDLSGNIRFDLKNDPDIDGKLRSKYLDIAWLTKPLEEQVEDGSQDGTAQDRQQVFPDEPIPTLGIGGMELDLDLAVDYLKLDVTELNGVVLQVLIRDDLIKLDPFEFGGPLGEKVFGKLSFGSVQDIARLDFMLDANGFRLGLAMAEGQDVNTIPPTDITINVTGSGATYHELASSLNGRFRLVQGKGLIANGGLDLIFSDLLSELFAILNPFAKKSAYTNLECTVANAEIESGKVLVKPIIIQTEQLTIFSSGEIDLASEKMSLDFQTKLRKGIGISAGMVVNPFIRLGGSLSSPSIELDPAAVVVSGSVAVATVGLSLVGKSLWDRFLTSKDPCGKALKQLAKEDAARQ
jgi:hypothetical protein